MTDQPTVADRQMAEAAGAEPHQDALLVIRKDDLAVVAIPTKTERPGYVHARWHRESVVLAWNGSDHGVPWETVQEPLPEEEEHVLAWQARMCRIAPSPDEFAKRTVKTRGERGPEYQVSIHPGAVQGEYYALIHRLYDHRWTAATHPLLQALLGNEYRIVVLQKTGDQWTRFATDAPERTIAVDPSDLAGLWRLEAIGDRTLAEALKDAQHRDPRLALRQAAAAQEEKLASAHRALLEAIDRAALLHLADQALAFAEDEPEAMSFDVMSWPDDSGEDEPFDVRLGSAYDADGRDISDDAADGGAVPISSLSVIEPLSEKGLEGDDREGSIHIDLDKTLEWVRANC